MSTRPGAVPRGCYACLRGNLAADARTGGKERTFATARIGVNMAAPDVAAEMRDAMTEWVNVMAFSDALQAKLLKCKKGDGIVVMGNVTKKPYTTQGGEERIDRTIIADAIMSAAASTVDAPERSISDAAEPHAPPST